MSAALRYVLLRLRDDGAAGDHVVELMVDDDAAQWHERPLRTAPVVHLDRHPDRPDVGGALPSWRLCSSEMTSRLVVIASAR